MLKILQYITLILLLLALSLQAKANTQQAFQSSTSLYLQNKPHTHPIPQHRNTNDINTATYKTNSNKAPLYISSEQVTHSVGNITNATETILNYNTTANTNTHRYNITKYAIRTTTPTEITRLNITSLTTTQTATENYEGPERISRPDDSQIGYLDNIPLGDCPWYLLLIFPIATIIIKRRKITL